MMLYCHTTYAAVDGHAVCYLSSRRYCITSRVRLTVYFRKGCKELFSYFPTHFSTVDKACAAGIAMGFRVEHACEVCLWRYLLGTGHI